MKVINKLELIIPLVSIVIPSYNRSDLVSQTIDSILNQECDLTYEIIIGDDCSTDNVREILTDYKKKFPEKIKLLFHDNNIGLGANWATCVKAAKGKYICNCDNDDYWHNPEKLKIQFDYLERYPKENVLITNHRNHNRNTGIITEEEAWIDRKISLQKAIFSGRYKFCNATFMYRTEFLKSHINLDDFVKNQFTLQDWNTWVILSAYTDFTILPISTATFGIETESITRPKDYNIIQLRLKNEKECYKYVCDLFPNDLPFDEGVYDNYVIGVLLGMAYRISDYRNAKKYGSLLKISGDRSIKILCSQSWIAFSLFCLLKKLMKKI